MNLKQLFAALLVPALSATVFAGIASADYSYNAATGTRTWTFNTPAEKTYLNTKRGTTFYLYSDTLSDSYDTEAAAKAAKTDEDLLITSTVGSSVYVNYIGAGELYGLYNGNTHVYYTAPFDGTITVDGTTNTTIGGTAQKEMQVKAGDDINISSNSNRWTVTVITFTPNTSTKTFDVKSITIDNDTKDAGVTFTADGYNVWNCSIWNKVQDFKGNVDFNVQMTNVPTNVEVSAQSYAN